MWLEPIPPNHLFTASKSVLRGKELNGSTNARAHVLTSELHQPLATGA